MAEHSIYAMVLEVIEANFPGEKPFDVKDLEEKFIEVFGEKLRDYKAFSAAIGNLVIKGIFARAGKVSSRGLKMYYKRADAPKYTPRPPRNRRISSKEVLKCIDAHFPEQKPFFARDILGHFIGVASIALISDKLKRLADKIGTIERMQRNAFRFMEYRRAVFVPVPGKEYKQEAAPGAGQESPPPAPKAEAPPPEKRPAMVSPGVAGNAELTREILEHANIPLSLVGEAIYTMIRDLNSQLRVYSESEAKMQREIDALKARIKEQYQQMEHLNIRIAALNREKQAPLRPWAIGKLGDLAKISMLKK